MRSTIVDLDMPCGAHFRVRDFVECSETYRRLRAEGRPVDNVPREPETIAAMVRLGTTLLDPVAEEFGAVQLTYGFAASSLTRNIRRHICPALDQHAGAERKKDGAPICPRRGIAVDLLIGGVPSLAVARWIVAHVPFDRLYYYGEDSPLHVSVGPERTGAIVQVSRAGGRSMPRQVTSIEQLADRLPGG